MKPDGSKPRPTARPGFYEIHGLYDRDDEVSASKDGYQPYRTRVNVAGDLRFDIQLVKP